MCSLLSRLTFMRFNAGILSSTLLSRMASSDSNNLSHDSSKQLPVITEKVGNVYVIGINRPDKRNCVNSYTASHLLKAFEDFEKDDSLYVAILHGKGGNFCAGYDLSEVASYDQPSNLTDFASIFSTKKRPMGPTHMQFSKPTIAAVSGYAVAGGLELSLLCDLRIVEETAIMGVFCRRFGVPLLDGGTVRLPQIIGLGRALDLILTGRSVNAKEALELGLANRVVACGTALGQAMSLANSLCNFPQACMRADRNSAIFSMTAGSMEKALEYEWDNSIDVLVKESVEGAAKFVKGVGRHGKFDSVAASKL